MPRPTDWLVPWLDWLADRRETICSTVVMPSFFRSSTLMTVTGTAVSASIRLIAEPVISTRSAAAVQTPALRAEQQAAPKAIIRLVQTLVFLNIGPPDKHES